MKHTIVSIKIIIIFFSSISFAKINENFKLPYVRECVAASEEVLKKSNQSITPLKVKKYCSCTFDEMSKDMDDAEYLDLNDKALENPKEANKIMAKYAGICVKHFH